MTGARVAMTGGVVSDTVTVNCDQAQLFAASLAVHVIVVAPNGNWVPEAGVQVAVTGPSTASVAAGSVYVTFAPAELVAAPVTGA